MLSNGKTPTHFHFQIHTHLSSGKMSLNGDENRTNNGLQVETGIELPNRSENEPVISPMNEQPEPSSRNEDLTNDLEAGNRSRNSAARPVVDQSKLLDPIRTDPIKALELRKRRMDRQADSSMPEIHYVGQIVSARRVINDSTEGAFCRYVYASFNPRVCLNWYSKVTSYTKPQVEN